MKLPDDLDCLPIKLHVGSDQTGGKLTITSKLCRLSVNPEDFSITIHFFASVDDPFVMPGRVEGSTSRAIPFLGRVNPHYTLTEWFLQGCPT